MDAFGISARERAPGGVFGAGEAWGAVRGWLSLAPVRACVLVERGSEGDRHKEGLGREGVREGEGEGERERERER
jgi:hypothetical protein